MRLPVETGSYDGSTIMDADGHLVATAETTVLADEIVTLLNRPCAPQIVRGGMQSLIDAFPTLKRKGCVWRDDRNDFRRQMRGMSHSERCAGQFVLSVWNYLENKFDLHDALNVWDAEHHAAFLAWAANPWYK